MNIIAKLKVAFEKALSQIVKDPTPYLEMIRLSENPAFGDYQANMAMPLKKEVDLPPRQIAEKIVSLLDVSDFCETPEIAGPGFINLRLKDSWVLEQVETALHDPRLGVAKTNSPKKVVVDYSSPNVAKPMHVGHIRSTVIGDSLKHILRFLGHEVIADNHLGDWGTQFGMIIYGYRNLLDKQLYAENPVLALGSIYRLVRKLMDYQSFKANLSSLEKSVADLTVASTRAAQEAQTAEKAEKKNKEKAANRAAAKVKEAEEELEKAQKLINAVESDPFLSGLAAKHPKIGEAVLEETAKLHRGDEENLKLWKEVLPFCRDELNRIYKRLNIQFDVELGESFYHDQLQGVVDSLAAKGLTQVSNGATCVFLEGFDAPMIVRKQDGAFLYSTTDLATIEYRVKKWNPDLVLYVVDFRQGDHFSKLFSAAKLWGYATQDLRHIAFGTVMDANGKPFKTRDGDTVGLEGLLNEAVFQARQVVDKAKGSEQFSDEEKREISEVVGLGALKYADLSQHRTSNYEFSYEKMLQMVGNTAPYLQYGYARIQGILRKLEITPTEVRSGKNSLQFAASDIERGQERNLALLALRFENALLDATVDFTPHTLAVYLFSLAEAFASFYDKCSIKDAPSEEIKSTRLKLCVLVGDIIRTGLNLLGIRTLDRM